MPKQIREFARFGGMPTNWKLVPRGYRLDHAGLVGKLPLHGTAPGLRNLSLAWHKKVFAWPGPLLAVRAIQSAGHPPFQVGFSESPGDHRVRAGLLDIQLDRTNRFPARMQVYWDTTRSHRIDMEILVTTVDAFEKLEVITWSQAPTTGAMTHDSECLVQVSDNASCWVDVREASSMGAKCLVVPRNQAGANLSLDGRLPSLESFVLAPSFRTPILCYRPAGLAWSYVEMSLPEDCIRIIACPRLKCVEWGFGLFGLDIEKGVILRGRICGAFVPRKGDTQRAEKLFRKFLAEPPHLSV